MDETHGRQMLRSMDFRQRMKGANGMKTMFKAISGIGFVGILIGCGAMDSASTILPLMIVLIGIALYAIGTKAGEMYG